MRQHRSQVNIYKSFNDSFDIGFDLPATINSDSIIRLERSHFPGNEADKRFKNLISKAFSIAEGNSLLKVCQYIASNALIAHYPKGSRFKTTQICAIFEKDKYPYDERYKTENKGTYLEYQVSDKCVCVIKHTYQES